MVKVMLALFKKLKNIIPVLFVLIPALLIAQTDNTTTIDTVAMTSLLTGLINAIIPVLFIVIVLGIVLRLFGKIPEMVKFAIPLMLILIPLTTLAQTSSTTTIDLSGVLTLFTSMLPLLFMLMIIMMIFKLFGGLFESFGRMFNFIAPVMLLAQTTTPSIDTAVSVFQNITPIITALISIIVIIVFPLLVFKVLAGSILKIIRE